MPQGNPMGYFTPPFVGGDGETQDLINQLNQLYAPPPQMAPPQPEGIGGFFRNLLQALPQALSVGLSPDPGAVLQRQIERRQALEFQRQQEEAQRRFQLEMMQRNVKANLIQSEIAERRNIRGEGRAEQRKIREEKRAEEAAIGMMQRKLEFAPKEWDAKLAWEKDNEVTLSRLARNRQWLEALPQRHRKSVELADHWTEIVGDSIHPEVISRIADKIADVVPEELTQEETRIYNIIRRTRKERVDEERSVDIEHKKSVTEVNKATAEAGGRGRLGAGGAFSGQSGQDRLEYQLQIKLMEKMMDGVAEEYFRDTRTGEIKSKSQLGKFETLEVGGPIVPLSPEENLQEKQRRIEDVQKLIHQMRSRSEVGAAVQESQPAASPQSPVAGSSRLDELRGYAEEYRAKGRTDEQIRQNLKRFFKATDEELNKLFGAPAAPTPKTNENQSFLRRQVFGNPEEAQLRKAYEIAKKSDPSLTFQQFKDQVFSYRNQKRQ